MSDLEWVGWAYLVSLVCLLIAVACVVYTSRFDK